MEADDSRGHGAATRARGPLSGVRVLELGTLIAGPFAGRLFADYGADVIKVEHPKGGDPLRDWGRTVGGHGSLWSLVQGRGKRSIALDLHDPEAQQVVLALAKTADVMIENFRPGRLEEWGLGPTILESVNPRLILVRISGFGQTGPLAQQAGFGTIAEAVGGLRYLTGDPERPPTRAGLSLGDSVASLYAMIGALIALHERTTSGRGQTVDVALTESVFSLLEGGASGVQLLRDGARTNRQHRPQFGTDECVPLPGLQSRRDRRQLVHPVRDADAHDRPSGACDRPRPSKQPGPRQTCG